MLNENKRGRPCLGLGIVEGPPQSDNISSAGRNEREERGLHDGYKLDKKELDSH